METSVIIQDLVIDSKLETILDSGSDSGYSRMSSSNLNFSSQSNTTTNSSSSSNSLAFTSEEDEYEKSKYYNQFNGLNDKIQRAITCNSIDSTQLSSNKFSLNLIRNSSSNLNNINNSNSNPVGSNSIPNLTNSVKNSSSSETSLPSPLIQIQTNNKYIFILNAFVNGFAQLKLCADKIDYEYIIEIYWSNEVKTFIKRTYEDFVTFHKKLFQTFAQYFNEIKSNKNLIKLKRDSNKRNSKYFSNTNGYIFDQDEHQLPVLPPSKKPFWVSHLKLAESREIELNTYVQRILNLPTKVSHSPLVLQFFESQSSDPKPAKFCRMLINNTSNGSDSVGDDREYEEEVEDEDDDNNINEEDQEINSEFENDQNEENCEEEDEEELFEDDLNIPNLNKINLNEFETLHNLDFNNSKRFNNRNNQQNVGQNTNCFNVKTKKKSNNNNNDNKEAGLWWDEDEALNELTSSISFEFGNHRNHTQCHDLNDYDDDELDELETLETMLRNSDLFRNDIRTQTESNTTAISSSSTTMIRNNAVDNQPAKRLSLS